MIFCEICECLIEDRSNDLCAPVCDDCAAVDEEFDGHAEREDFLYWDDVDHRQFDEF